MILFQSEIEGKTLAEGKLISLLTLSKIDFVRMGISGGSEIHNYVWNFDYRTITNGCGKMETKILISIPFFEYCKFTL